MTRPVEMRDAWTLPPQVKVFCTASCEVTACVFLGCAAKRYEAEKLWRAVLRTPTPHEGE